MKKLEQTTVDPGIFEMVDNRTIRRTGQISKPHLARLRREGVYPMHDTVSPGGQRQLTFLHKLICYNAVRENLMLEGSTQTEAETAACQRAEELGRKIRALRIKGIENLEQKTAVA